jgi:zinc transporter, ZIP family
MMPAWLEAAGWGLLAGSALIAGAAVGYLVRIPQRIVATVMAFGAGVLLAAGAILAMVADTMIPEAFERAHLLIGLVTVAGFLVASAWRPPADPSAHW